MGGVPSSVKDEPIKDILLHSSKEVKIPSSTLSESTNFKERTNTEGIISRAINDIFYSKRSFGNHGRMASIQLSCLEIYNEELRDLMFNDSDALSSSSSSCPVSLTLRDNGIDDEGVTVTGLSVATVESIEEANELIEKAQIRRTTASTRVNERSSRSHAIYTLSVTLQPSKSKESEDKIEANDMVQAKLTLVDLAGSERIKDTGVVGSRRRESININRDLFTLGKVVSALSERTKKNSAQTGSKTNHIPYRDCKLTRLLRDSLGGTTFHIIICCQFKPFFLFSPELISLQVAVERC